MQKAYFATGLTDKGLIRKHNEDSILIDTDLNLLIVADGMGGHHAGEVASCESVRIIHDAVKTIPPGTLAAMNQEYESYNTLKKTITEILIKTNNQIYNDNSSNGFPEGSGMGTTVVGAWLFAKQGKMVIFNIGDSRLYRFRDDQLQQLTKDHSLLQNWKDTGCIGSPPNSNIISQAIGPFQHIEPEIQIQNIEKNDRFLLCSDGLYEMVNEHVLISSLSNLTEDNLQASCTHLINKANQNGGRDNISAILCGYHN